MLAHSVLSLTALRSRPDFAGTLVMLAPQDSQWIERGLDSLLCERLGEAAPVLALPEGGASRRDSVLKGLSLLGEALGRDVENDWVLVHDAARPDLSDAALQRLLHEGLSSEDGALLALPMADTLKRADAQDPCRSLQTVPREGLWAAQTPQLFRVGALIRALAAHPEATDEASAMEVSGARPLLVLGEAANRKLTFLQDFSERNSMMETEVRMGQGFDVHALVEGRPLIIGGVHIPHSRGLLGHSDADVLLHAVADAILGAACMGDIGHHFPDSDPAFRGADSRHLLRHVVCLVHGAGLRVVQVDATVIAQEPKLAPHIPQMVSFLAADTQCDRVNVKATTTEHLGFTGRKEGIAAQALALLSPRRSQND